MIGTTMPEAAVDEDGDTLPTENDVGTTAQCGHRTHIQAVSQTEGV